MAERGDRMAAQIVPDVRKETLRGGAVKHAAKEWSWYWRTSETFHTNSVEGFWRLFKASVRSTQSAKSGCPLTSPSSAIGRATASSGTLCSTC
jgi:hypothetical protein